ncbi:hypothetical protein PV328_008856 [Microctonus aethiopoides]|uniref:Uncharacterized protein n=1 Tax=Microctonus aethiopoides TaxID=144406 RepID=A0AA39FKH0_9HYME|nr:hypothetical protein PV328_008856 [Microctonus aethiopoides]
MIEMHIILTVICLCYFGLSVSACGSKGNSQSYRWHSNHKQSSCQQTNQLDQNTMVGSRMIYSKQYGQTPYRNQLNYNAITGSNIHYPKQYSQIPSTMHYPASNVFIPPKPQYGVPNFIDPYMNTQQNLYRCLRGVHSMPINQQPTQVVNKRAIKSFPNHLNLQNDLIKHRVRRNIDENTEAPDSTTTQSWVNFWNSFLMDINSDEGEDSDDEKLPDRREVTDHSNDSADSDISKSDRLSETSAEFFDRIRQRIPYFFQRLRLLRKLLNNSTSDEEMTMNGQLEKLNDDIISVEDLKSEVITTETFLEELKKQDFATTPILSIPRHENTTPKS